MRNIASATYEPAVDGVFVYSRCFTTDWLPPKHRQTDSFDRLMYTEKQKDMVQDVKVEREKRIRQNKQTKRGKREGALTNKHNGLAACGDMAAKSMSRLTSVGKASIQLME